MQPIREIDSRPGFIRVDTNHQVAATSARVVDKLYELDGSGAWLSRDLGFVSKFTQLEFPRLFAKWAQGTSYSSEQIKKALQVIVQSHKDVQRF